MKRDSLLDRVLYKISVLIYALICLPGPDKTVREFDKQLKKYRH